MQKTYYKKIKNPLKFWCNPNVQLNDIEINSLSNRMISHIFLKQAYKGNGCWDFNKILLAYVATIRETDRIGKFLNISPTLARKLIILEDAVMAEYINFDHTGISEFIDNIHFQKLKEHYSKRI